jgi:hypothetical protein
MIVLVLCGAGCATQKQNFDIVEGLEIPNENEIVVGRLVLLGPLNRPQKLQTGNLNWTVGSVRPSLELNGNVSSHSLDANGLFVIQHAAGETSDLVAKLTLQLKYGTKDLAAILATHESPVLVKRGQATIIPLRTLSFEGEYVNVDTGRRRDGETYAAFANKYPELAGRFGRVDL